MLECLPMNPGTVPPWPRRLSDLARADRPAAEAELASLLAARDAGLSVASIVVLPAELEERFYRWNTLPERITELFAHVDPADPDEDDLEELAPAAQALIERHYLLDEVVDAFYERIEALPGRLRIRRPGHEGVVALRGRPALIAVKRLWAADWSFDALTERLERTGRFALDARAVLVHGVDRPAPPDLERELRDLFGGPVRAWSGEDGGLTRVSATGSAPADQRSSGTR